MSGPKTEYIIYGLVCPEAACVRYVGRSSHGFQRALRHGWPRSLAADKTYKANWIRGLRAKGLDYSVVVLSRHNLQDELNEAERYWIKYLKDAGCPLTNLTDGGDRDYTVSEEVRKKLSAIRKGKPHSPEWNEAIRQSHLGRKYPPEVRARMGRKRTFLNKVVDEAGREYANLYQAADVLGLKRRSLYRLLSGQRKSLHGHRLRYIDND